MKRILIIATALALLLCIGCGQEPVPAEAEATPIPATPAPTATPEPTPVPTPSPTPEPPTEAGTVLVNEAGILHAYLERGDQVNVTGEQDGYYTVSLDGVDVLVEKWLVRMDGVSAIEERTGYAKNGTEVYKTAYLEGEMIASLNTNTVVTVKDEIGDRLYIEWDGQQGYVLAECISNHKISSGGGGGGGGGADGGDIVLGSRYGFGFEVVRLVLHEQEQPLPFAPGMGTILSARTEAYLQLVQQGDTVKVLSAEDGICSILAGERIGTLPRNLLQLVGDAIYEPWDGYARNKAKFYANHRLTGEAEELKVNTHVHIVLDLGDRYMAEVDDKIGFIVIDAVSENQIRSGGGGGGGGEWTAPVL